MTARPGAEDQPPGPVPPPDPGRLRIRRLLPLGVLLLGVVAVFAFDLHRYADLETLRRNRADLLAYVAANAWWASLLYLAVYAAAVAVSFPGASVLTLFGGFLFGTAHASVLVVAAATCGAVTVFLAVRHAFAETVRARAAPWLRRMEGGFNRDAFSYLLTLRLIPLFPFWLVNLVPALLGVRLVTFAASTALGIIPGTVVYAALGSGVGASLDLGRDPDLGIVFRPEILLPLIGLALLSLAPVAYRKWRERRGG